MGIFNRKNEKNISPEEAQLKHQSAPRPTAKEALLGLIGKRKQNDGAIDGFQALKEVIGTKQIQKARQTLLNYKQGKANLEQRIIDNEQWYKLRHWECMRAKNEAIKPTSAWLFNCIENKVADMLDNTPSANVLPREAGDREQAKMLSSILPVVLDQADFEQTYADFALQKVKSGTGVYGVFWDSSKLNGLGDISIQSIDTLSLFWESGIKDIQKSRNIFHVELCDNDVLKERYPKLQHENLGTSTLDLNKYVYDDSVDTTNKSAVVDWYYKKYQNGKTVLHYCKFVNDVVLYATENDPTLAERGWYDHGLYPFVFDPMFAVEGSPAGFGFVDVSKNPQEFIDRGNAAMMTNMLVNARPRYLTRIEGGINEEEFCDLEKSLVHVEGNISTDTVARIESTVFNDVYVTAIRDKIEELKETTGTRDVSTGGTTSGVTAASAIASLIENGSKLSRSANKGAFRAFKKMCLMSIELIRQFYDMPRQFRIIGENGAAEYVTYSNAGIRAQHQGIDFGVDTGYRLPLFDIEISVEKKTEYSRMAQNELVLQFYQLGMFDPSRADMSLMAIDMMDFDRKEQMMQKIAQNGTMFQKMMAMQQQMVALAQMVDEARGSNIAQQLIAQFSGGQPVAPIDGNAPRKVEETEALGGEGKEPSHTKKARQRVAESTNPT